MSNEACWCAIGWELNPEFTAMLFDEFLKSPESIIQIAQRCHTQLLLLRHIRSSGPADQAFVFDERRRHVCQIVRTTLPKGRPSTRWRRASAASASGKVLVTISLIAPD